MLLRRAVCSLWAVILLIGVGVGLCTAGEWTEYEITHDTVWDPSENPIVLMRDLHVLKVNPDDASDRIKLEIKPGVVVKLGPHVDIFADGVLIARDAVFTSINDDTTVDGPWEGSTGSPQIGDWNSIHLYNHESRLEACTLRYGKSIEIDNCSPYLFGNQIERFSRYGLFIVARDELVSPVISCNTIQDIGEPYVDNNPANGKFDPGQEEYQDIDMNNQYDPGVAIYCYTPPESYGPCVPLIQFNKIVMNTQPGLTRGFLPIVFENTLPLMLPIDGTLQAPIPDGNMIRQKEGDESFVSAIGIKGYIKPGEQIGDSGEYRYTEYLLPLVSDDAVASSQTEPKNQHLPYVILEDLVISAGCSLSVPENCVVKFSEGTNLEIEGSIETSQYSSAPCYFTSLHNDVEGLRVPGSISTPTPGDWGRIRIQCDDCLIANCRITYGTYVMIDQCSPTFINNTIDSNYQYGLYIYAEAYPAAPEVSRNVIMNCGHIVDESEGLYEGGGICLETSREYLGPCSPRLQDNRILHNFGFPLILLGTCAPTYTRNTLTSNYYQAVGIGGTIRGEGAVWYDVTGKHFPYVVIEPLVIAGGYSLNGQSTSVQASDPQGGALDTLVDVNADWKTNVLTGAWLSPNTQREERFQISSNTRTAIVVSGDLSGVAEAGDSYEVVVADTTVEVPQGTIIKLARDMDIFVKGRLWLQGTSSNKVYFTSFNDDSVGGSVLLTGPTPMPEPGDWGIIKYENDNNKIEECVLKYGTSLFIDSCSPIIQHNSIAMFSEAGIYCFAHHAMASPQILNNAILCNRNGVRCETDPGFSDPNGACPRIHSNDIMNNENYGVVTLQPAAVIDARENWWGSNDGPSGEGTGHGDAVSANVEYLPFQQVPNYVMDSAPPAFSDLYPAPYSTGVSTNTIIMLTITDVKTGVDTNSVSIKVNHHDGAGYVYVYKEGTDERYNGGSVTVEEVQNGYRYTYTPGRPFTSDTLVCVICDAADLALCPNWQTETFCFRTGKSIGLSFGQVTPAIGTTRTQFTYCVDFFDRDLAAPSSAKLYIDGSPRNMELSAGDAWEGTYCYTTSLKVGYHTFYFEFTGGKSGITVRLPLATDIPPYLYGPTVLSEEKTTSWPMFRHDPQHSGSSPVGATSAPTLNWSFVAAGYIISSPVVGPDNTVYFGCYDGNVYAVNTDGTVRWAAATGDYVAATPALGEDGSLYVGSTDSYFYAFTPDGALRWSYKTGGEIVSSPVIGLDGNIYFGCNDGYLYSMTSDGELRWRFGTTSWVTSSPAIWFDGTVFFGSDDNMVYAVRNDGNLRWSFDTGGWVSSSPAVGPDETVYVGTGADTIVAINSDGTLKWRVYTGDIVHSSPALSDEGVVYVGSYDRKLYAIDAQSGTVIWTYLANGPIHTSPAIDGKGNVLFGSHDGNLYCVGPDGTLVWRFYDPQRSGRGYQVHGSPAVGPDGSVYFGSEEKLYALKELPVQNAGPVLSDESCEPVGKSRSRYRFQIHYFDKDDDAPSAAKLVVDDAAYELSLTNGEKADGDYSLAVLLTPGEHTHYYVFADAFGKVARYPVIGRISGPNVPANNQGSPPLSRSMPPTVWMAGYFGSRISESLGGNLHIVAYCTDPDGDIARVDLCYNGKPLGVELKDDGESFDGLAGDGLYGCYLGVKPGLKQGAYVFEIVATDSEGNQSNVWPYVTIDDYPHLWIGAQPPVEAHSVAGPGRGETDFFGEENFAGVDLSVQNRILDAIRGIASREYSGSSPEILMAGFGSSKVDYVSGGRLSVGVIVNDPDGATDIASVVARKPSAAGEFEFKTRALEPESSDGQRVYFGSSCFIPGGGERGHHIIEVFVTDKAGHLSHFFPYLVVSK